MVSAVQRRLDRDREGIADSVRIRLTGSRRRLKWMRAGPSGAHRQIDRPRYRWHEQLLKPGGRLAAIAREDGVSEGRIRRLLSKAHPREDLAIFRVTNRKMPPLCNWVPGRCHAARNFTAMGYPVHLLKDHGRRSGSCGAVLDRPELIIAKGHIRRRFTYRLPSFRGDSLAEMSDWLGQGSSGGPIVDHESSSLLGVYLGERYDRLTAGREEGQVFGVRGVIRLCRSTPPTLAIPLVDRSGAVEAALEFSPKDVRVGLGLPDPDDPDDVGIVVDRRHMDGAALLDPNATVLAPPNDVRDLFGVDQLEADLEIVAPLRGQQLSHSLVLEQ